MIRAQSRPDDLACLLVNGVRDDRKRMHIQPNTRTLNNHRRPPDLQMWLYQRECSPTPATQESFCSTRPSASLAPIPSTPAATTEATEVAGLDVAGLLGRLGFRVHEQTVPYIGLVFADGTGPAIYGVLDTARPARAASPRKHALTAIDGVTFDRQALKWAIANQDAVVLSMSRGNQTLTYQICVQHRTQIRELCWIGDDRQAGRIQAWLDSDFHPTQEQVFPLNLYSSFHGAETVTFTAPGPSSEVSCPATETTCEGFSTVIAAVRDASPSSA